MPYSDPKKRKEYHKEYSKNWEKNNVEKRKMIQKKHDLKRNVLSNRKKQLSEVRWRRHHRNKVKVLLMYGKCCAYCGCETYEFLTVDHINNDGHEHRKTSEYKRLNVGGMWGFLAKTPYEPEKYQILCYNCNCAKQHYNIHPLGEKTKTFEWYEEKSKLRYNYE